jgi:alkylation response protein AidB-like acyl-CoA dehydrogenase
MSASLTGETRTPADGATSSQFEEVRKTLRKFYEQEVKPRRDEMDKDPEVCRELIKKLGRLGMLTPTFPEQYGGFEATREFRGMMAGEASRVSPSLSLSAGAHSLLCANTVFFFGNDEQRSHYLPKLSSAEMIGCWGVTEPEAGSDVGSMRSTAVLQGDKYVLNGNKTFITNAPIADMAVVFARPARGPTRSRASSSKRARRA